MANMGYVRFENTYNALLDCYDRMEDVLSESESEFRDALIDLCTDIVEDYGNWECNGDD